MTFARLRVPSHLVDVLERSGITTPTPIQAATLPDSLAGRDVLGRGRTGSGKTYAFLLPILARLAESGQRRQPSRPRALILVPTRELARQVETALAPLAKASKMRTLVVFGGVGQNPQVQGLRAGVDVLVACPGRLEDLINQGHCRLDAVEVAVLDEADHMADLGFLPGVKRLLDRTPKGGQRLLFSATLDAGVDVIVKRYLDDPVTHHADSARSPVSTMDHHVLHIGDGDRLDIVAALTGGPSRTLVFTRTKYGAKKLAKQLNGRGVPAVELHGNLAQNARIRNLDAFHSGSATTLVATDIAARGIHVDDVGLVVHADPPVEHKAYLHRSGRTARAGADGTVVTLMTDAQVKDVRALTKAAGIRPTTTRVNAAHPLLVDLAPQGSAALGITAPPVATPAPDGRRESSSRGRRGQGGQGGQGHRGDRSDLGERAGQEQGARSDGSGRRRSRRGGSGRGRSTARADAHAPARTATKGSSSSRRSGGAGGARSGGAAAFSARSAAGRGR